jgi:hypothetical protein
MRAIQKVIIIIYCLLVTVACIYAPWRLEMGGAYKPFGYFPIWQEPALSSYLHKEYPEVFLKVDITRVTLEIIIITVILTIFFVLTLRNKKKQNREINIIEKPSVLDKYRKNHMIFFALWWVNLLFLVIPLPIVSIIVSILTLTFLIINIVDTIRVFKIIFPTPKQITTTVLMFILLVPFAGLYVNGLIKTYKTNLSITPSTDKGLNDSNDEEINIKSD